MFWRKKIPPPLDPPQQQRLTIPFEIAEQTRVFIDALSRSPAIRDDIREFISSWLTEYSDILGSYILSAYGYPGVMAADAMSAGLVQAFRDRIETAYTEKETELFARFEDEMRNDE